MVNVPEHLSVANGSFLLPDAINYGDSMVCGKTPNMAKAYSRGWFFDDPLQSSVPFLMIQMTFMICISKTLYYLLRPLRQPRIVCDIIGGIILGSNYILPRTSMSSALFMTPETLILLLRTVAAYGLMFHLFIMGVKMDLAIVGQSGRTVLWVGISSVLLPFGVMCLTSYMFRDFIMAAIARGRYLVFLAASVSVTAFPVLGDLLAELNILTTDLGRLAMSSAMINGLFGWFAMVLFTAFMQHQNGGYKYSLLFVASMVAMMVFIFGVARPAMKSIIQKTPRGKQVPRVHIFAILTTVMILGIFSDAIGASPMDGPLMLGLVVPDGPPLGAAIVDKVELLVSEVLMPLVFYTVGNMTSIPPLEAWVDYLPLIFIIVLGYTSKLVGTILPAMACKMSLRDSALLGIIMCLQGIVEIMTLYNFTFGSLLDQEGFTILLIFTMLSTAVYSPLLTIIYNPLTINKKRGGGRTIQHMNSHTELLMLVCVHNESPVPSLISLIEASSASSDGPMSVYALHLVELQGRASSTLIHHRDKKGYINPTNMDRLLNAFINYEQETKGRVTVVPFTTVSPYKSMHQDICSLAVEKKVALIVIPYPRKDTKAEFQPSDLAVRSILSDILSQAPCSVGILVHQTLSCPVISWLSNYRLKIGILFWGGPDDREALAYASHIAQHNGVGLKVTRFMPKIDMRDNTERILDDRLVEDFKMAHSNNQRIMFDDVLVKDGEDTLLTIRSMDTDYDLLIVGRRQGPNSCLSEELKGFSESPELGTIGDVLASPDINCTMSLLIIHQFV